jgi:hypothetical protein
MRQKRKLAEKVWYGVETAINVGEPLFKLLWAEVIFCRVLIEAKKRFDFEMRGLVLRRYSSNALTGSGASIGGVEEMAKKEIPAAKTYKTVWVSPRRAVGTVKVRFSFKTALVSANPPG